MTQQRGPDGGAPFPDTFWVELGHALVDDSSWFPATDLPVHPTAGDLAGPAEATIPTPEP